MPRCPRCDVETIEGAYGCAVCGHAFPTPPHRRPQRWPLALGAVAGCLLGGAAGFRWGGYAAPVAMLFGAFLGTLLGVFAGSSFATFTGQDGA
jgi:uncharacterized membrane protein